MGFIYVSWTVNKRLCHLTFAISLDKPLSAPSYLLDGKARQKMAFSVASESLIKQAQIKRSRNCSVIERLLEAGQRLGAAVDVICLSGNSASKV